MSTAVPRKPGDPPWILSSAKGKRKGFFCGAGGAEGPLCGVREKRRERKALRPPSGPLHGPARGLSFAFPARLQRGAPSAETSLVKVSDPHKPLTAAWFSGLLLGLLSLKNNQLKIILLPKTDIFLEGGRACSVPLTAGRKQPAGLFQKARAPTPRWLKGLPAAPLPPPCPRPAPPPFTPPRPTPLHAGVAAAFVLRYCS